MRDSEQPTTDNNKAVDETVKKTYKDVGPQNDSKQVGNNVVAEV